MCHRVFSGSGPHSTQRRAEQLPKHELAAGAGFLGTEMRATAFLRFVLGHPLEPTEVPGAGGVGKDQPGYQTFYLFYD